MFGFVLDAAKKAAKAITPRQATKREKRKERIEARRRFQKARIAEKQFAKRLISLARQIGKLVNTLAPGGRVKDPAKVTQALARYEKTIEPWAQQASKRFVEEIAQRDYQAWSELGREMGRSLAKEVRQAPTGKVMKKKMNEQVDLIKSLPRHAAERVHRLAIEAMSGGQRANEIAKEIMATGRVTENRAKLIAITEAGRTATAMVEARSRYLGSEGYIWRTAHDADVRDEHRRLEGKFIRWDKPPVAGPNGMRYHAGAGPRCRCHPEPVLPDVIR